MTVFTLAANVSTLFTELPYLSRFRAAADAGFGAAETWWPFSSAVPGTGELDEFLTAIDESGLVLSGLNLFAGDMQAGERGIVSHPHRAAEFAANLEAVDAIAEQTGCRMFNALYGTRLSHLPRAEQDAVAASNLRLAVASLGRRGGTVLIEPLCIAVSGPDYPIDSIASARHIISTIGGDGIGLLFDTYHLTELGVDVLGAIETDGSIIAHVQFADAPGRGEPASGAIPFDLILEHLEGAGYRGLVAAEYAPTASTLESLGWIDDLERVAFRPVSGASR